MRALPDIPDVFQAVESGECDYGVVPIENSTEGAVNRSLDLLVETELTIIAQVFLKVEHSLFSFSLFQKSMRYIQGPSSRSVWRLVAEKPTQCRLVPVTSTAEAVKSLNQEKKKTRPLLANLPGGFTRSFSAR